MKIAAFNAQRLGWEKMCDGDVNTLVKVKMILIIRRLWYFLSSMFVPLFR